MKKLVAGIFVGCIGLTGCATLDQQMTDITAQRTHTHPDRVVVESKRVTGVNLNGDTRWEWRAVADGVYYDCRGFNAASSICYESDDQFSYLEDDTEE